MEFPEVVFKRRMVGNFKAEPVEATAVKRKWNGRFHIGTWMQDVP